MNNAVYEDERFLAFNGGTLRPGGADMTREAVRDVPRGSHILDVGCGTGESVALLGTMGYQAAGIDASETLVEKGQRLGRNIAPGDAYTLEGGYDALLYECVLSLLPDKARALQSAYAALRPGGYLLLSDLYPRTSAAHGGIPCVTCINGILPLDRLENLLMEAGFSCERFLDRTAQYKGFVAALIMEYGSVETFFSQFMDTRAAAAACADTRKMKLGYFLSVWRKW